MSEPLTKAKILYVEDDVYLSYVTVDNLRLAGYGVVLCPDGRSALETYRSQPFDICILDVMLPEIDGFEVAGKIRETDKDIPILFLSAKTLKEDRLTGLRLGGDDYITKPFSIEELILKIEIFLRRRRPEKPDNRRDDRLPVGEYILEPATMTLIHGDGNINLTSIETELLKLLTVNSGKVLKKDDILNAVWGTSSYYNSRTLDVFVSRLRKYLARDPSVNISNVYGTGYILILKSSN